MSFLLPRGHLGMLANYANVFSLCNSVTYPAIKHTCYEGYRAFPVEYAQQIEF